MAILGLLGTLRQASAHEPNRAQLVRQGAYHQTRPEVDLLSLLEAHPPLARLGDPLTLPFRRRRRTVWLSLRLDGVDPVAQASGELLPSLKEV